MEAKTTEAIEKGERGTIPLMEGESLTVVVLGASGALANDKVMPALFELHKYKNLPQRRGSFHIVGYARSELDRGKWMERFRSKLDTGGKHGGEGLVDEFMDMCHYVRGDYDKDEAYRSLHRRLCDIEGDSVKGRNRMFFFAIPPAKFLSAGRKIHRHCRPEKGQIKVLIEKPFGTDLKSFEELSRGLRQCYEENEVYRVDHFVAKRVIGDLLSFRFGNTLWQPLWSGQYIRSIHVMLRESGGVAGRGAYFDGEGIIRDVMQNHLTQTLSLLLMDEPLSLNVKDVHEKKTELLQSLCIDEENDVIIGQYGRPSKGTKDKAEVKEGYLDDETVADDSIACTYAAAVITSKRNKWSGIPILLEAGKGMGTYRSEMRIRFRQPPSAERLFRGRNAINELVITVDPKQRLCMRLNNRAPGVPKEGVTQLLDTDLLFDYRSKYDYEAGIIPRPYRRILMEAMCGDMSSSVSEAELRAQWELWDSVVHHLEDNRIRPEVYPSGSCGPERGMKRLARKYDCPHWTE